MGAVRGTIRQRGEGRWQVQVYAGRRPDGTERRVARTIHGTRRDAETALAALITEVDAGRNARPGERLTLAQLLDRWLHQGAPDWSPATLATNTQHAHAYIVPHLGDVPIDRLRPADIDGLYATLRATLSAATVAKVHRSILNPALNRAVRWQLIATNPAAGTRIPPADDQQITPPTVDQVRALIANAAPWFAAYLRIAASTGARRGTLTALRWGTVDLDERTVRFERAVTVGQHEKANKGRRAFTATLSDGDAQALAAHRQAMLERAASVRARLGGDRYVWSPDPDSSGPYWPTSISREFARTRTRAKVDGVTLHGLKHFAVTQMLTAGVPVHVVAQRTGTTAGTLQRVYAHWIPAADAGAAEVMDGLLR